MACGCGHDEDRPAPSGNGLRARLSRATASLKRESVALALAIRDPRTPWYAKALGVCVLAYLVSPIDLIPDPIPVLGQLDDLILVPAGIWLVRRLVPRDVLDDCRARADGVLQGGGRAAKVAAVAVIVVWVILAVAGGYAVWRMW